MRDLTTTFLTGVEKVIAESNLSRKLNSGNRKAQHKHKPVRLGDTFNKWTIIGGITKRNNIGHPFYLCQCTCGSISEVSIWQLRYGKSSQCRQCYYTGKTNRKHGWSNTKLHNVWRNMKKRCSHKHSVQYPDYGGRGIFVCDAWLNNFVAFRDWSLANGYADGLQIDRKENDGPYSPENCRWVMSEVNNNNTRRSRYVVAFGETKTIVDWLKDDRCMLTRSCLVKRLNSGWEPEKALTVPTKKTTK